MGSSSSFLHPLTDDNFSQNVQSYDHFLVDFWAPWCGPCKRLHPVLEELGKKLHPTLIIGQINIEEQQKVSAQYHIMSIPTLILFRKGQEEDRRMGYADAATLEAWLGSFLDL